MEEESFQALRVVMESYAPISKRTWKDFTQLCSIRTLEKGYLLYKAGELPKSFAFVVSGLVRGYVVNEQGQEYNKNFFIEGQFPGSMTALLTAQPSRLAFETIEDTLLVEIDFGNFRRLLFSNSELMTFQIHYLETNWLLHKDAREIELVQDNATMRYKQFTSDFPYLADRLSLYHIALHLGVTPTQLSRIRNQLNKK